LEFKFRFLTTYFQQYKLIEGSFVKKGRTIRRRTNTAFQDNTTAIKEQK